MSEEINRVLTHILGDLFFITEESEIGTLRGEGILKERIYFVWNPIADTLFIKASKESSGINDSANLCGNPAPVNSRQYHHPPASRSLVSSRSVRCLARSCVG